MTEYDFSEEDIVPGEPNVKKLDGIEEDEHGHAWVLDWQDNEKPHPGFGGSTNIYGGYVDQCAKCGMYGYEFLPGTLAPPEKQIHKFQKCGVKIR